MQPDRCMHMQDVLAICGGTLPAWCRELVLSCKFLFPFELRRRYFHCTSFGIGRALQHLQSLQTAEGGSNNHSSSHHDRDSREVRLGRLARQKVGSAYHYFLVTLTDVSCPCLPEFIQLQLFPALGTKQSSTTLPPSPASIHHQDGIRCVHGRLTSRSASSRVLLPAGNGGNQAESVISCNVV